MAVLGNPFAGETSEVAQFRRLLRQRTGAYFAAHPPGADWRGWAKLVVGLALHGGTLAAIILWPVPAVAGLLLWVVNGLAQGFLLANVGHDAVHDAFTRRRSADRWLAHVLSLCAVDPDVYRLSHVLDHHGLMNVGQEDAALDVRGLLRVSPHQPASSLGRWQAWAAWPIYALALADVAFVRDFELARRHGQPRARLLVNKTLYLLVMLGLPLAFSPQPWWLVLPGFALALAAGGLMLLSLFQVTHLVEGTLFPATRAEAGGEVAHVLATTCDVAPDSFALALVGGGLHTHVAHHLYPGVCHVHYPALTRIIAAAAADAGVGYRVQSRFWGAVAGHHRLLAGLG